MAESRIKPMQAVLMLAERKEQEVAQQLSRQNILIQTEERQLQELDSYAKQYLESYSARVANVKPQELISYSGFIQRLGDAFKEQVAKLERLYRVRDNLTQAWTKVSRKRELVNELIERLQLEESLEDDKNLQKEVDELVSQKYGRADST
jgi:flagellar protein FliJ